MGRETSEFLTVATFIGHTKDITSLVFASSSSLISASNDKSIKFWQIDSSSITPDEVDPKPTPLPPAPIKSITLQAKDGVIITSDSDGVVKIWNISTGTCTTSLQTPAKDSNYRDVRLIDNTLVVGWHADGKIFVWDAKKGGLKSMDAPVTGLQDFRISGDGSKIFCLSYGFIQAWSRWTGEALGKVRTESVSPQLAVDGSRVWIDDPQSKYPGWDFGIPNSPPVRLPNTSTLHLKGTTAWNNDLSKIMDTTTGKEVFQLPGRFGELISAQWDGQYLVAGYNSSEMLILDFSHAPLQ